MLPRCVPKGLGHSGATYSERLASNAHVAAGAHGGGELLDVLQHAVHRWHHVHTVHLQRLAAARATPSAWLGLG
jgi:hypothetical protein